MLEGNPTPVAQPGPIRLAVVDTDSGFVRVLANRLEGMGWNFRTLAAPVPPEELVSMRLNALVIDLSLLGPQAWEYLVRVCEAVPGLGIVVCCEQSTVAQRVRGLRLGADDWVRKPCHPEEATAGGGAVGRRRKRAGGPTAPPRLLAGELEFRPAHFQALGGGKTLELTRREFELV